MVLAKHPAEVPVRSHEVLLTGTGGPLDPGGSVMLNAPFTGAGIEPDHQGMPDTWACLVVYSNEEDPTHGESANA
jgi:hypothetical protein